MRGRYQIFQIKECNGQQLGTGRLEVSSNDLNTIHRKLHTIKQRINKSQYHSEQCARVYDAGTHTLNPCKGDFEVREVI